MELFNKNGNTYNMIAHYEDRYGANHYFLELNSQFIIAYDYDKKQKCWARGKYFFTRLSALDAWKELIFNEADNLF